MRKLVLCVLAAIMFVACGKDDFGLNSQPEPQNPYAVTPEEAVQMLQSVIGGETTRSISVSDIQTLNKRAFVPSTRSGGLKRNIVQCLDDYGIPLKLSHTVVDIEGKGSAIMSADKRMEPIYAIMDKTKISAEKLLGAATRSASEEEDDLETFILGMLNSAIQRDIEEAEQRGIEMPLIPRDQTWRDTTFIAYQEPLLNTSWHQYPPFNKFYECKPGTNANYYAGCGPIALAQILYYNRFPSSINGETFDWNLIARHEKDQINAPTVADNEVAKFVYQIKEGTNTHPQDENDPNNFKMDTYLPYIQTFLRNIGYSDATLVNYSLNAVVDMVANKQLPVFASGAYTKSNGDKVGHAWVIDGCNIYKIDYWVRHYIDQFLYTETTRNINIINCVFGEGGNYDGSYTSGIFNTGMGNFNYEKMLITYSLN